MRLFCLTFLSIIALPIIASGCDGNQVWDDLKNKRDALTMFHQEFEISRAYKTLYSTQASKSSVMIDSAKEPWRERTISGSGGRVLIFDGKDSFEWEEESSEYVRDKRASKSEPPMPAPYNTADLDLSKAVERSRQSCGFTTLEHECVVIGIPIKPWLRNEATGTARGTGGSRRVVLDTVTGLMISARTIQYVQRPAGNYETDSTYALKRMSYNDTVDESLFQLPAAATDEVKELASWNAARIRRELGGKPAPELQLTGLGGTTIKLGALKGRTVLLEFWTTWCGPFRADGPSLDKLFEKYGDKNLTIIGISVSEERAVVEKFLREHHHRYRLR